MDSLAQLLTVVLATGIACQWLAWRLRLPAIVLLGGAGILLGPVLGWVRPSAQLGTALEPLVGLCVALILFEGGLRLRRRELRTVGASLARLILVASPLVWLLSAVAIRNLGGVPWAVAVVTGALLVVTGPTVILPLLRQTPLEPTTAQALKWEGILNDPVGALLAILAFEAVLGLAGAASPLHVLSGALLSLGVAGAVGGASAWLLGRGFRAGLVPEFLKVPATLVSALAVYGLVNLHQSEAGLLAVTVMGVLLGWMELPVQRDLAHFKDTIAILLVSMVFVLLTADLDPTLLDRFDGRHFALVGVLAFGVRPVAVGIACVGSDLSLRQRALIGWIGPRGVVAAATAGLLGHKLTAAGYPEGELVLPIVFAVIGATVVVHGLTLAPLARHLGLTRPPRRGLLLVGASPWTRELATWLRDRGLPVLVAIPPGASGQRRARARDLEVFDGDVLSDTADEDLDLSGYGAVLATTENDAYNALVCQKLGGAVFGRQGAFQTALEHGAAGDDHTMARSARGRVVFGDQADIDTLNEHLEAGWGFGTGQAPAGAIWIARLGDGAPELLTDKERPEGPDGAELLWFGPTPAGS